jgi:hypothetical protein
MRLQNSLVHIVGRPRVCGLFGDETQVCAFTTTEAAPSRGLCDSGANLCMTNNPNLLVDVCPWAPFTILLATSDGCHSHINVCRCCGLLPLPLIDGTTYYRTCFVNPYASETFISPQAIINSSGGSFDKWQMEGFTQGRPSILSMYSPSGLLKMSIKLCQQGGFNYSMTDTFTVDTNPRSRCSPFVGSAFTDLAPDVHLVNEDNASNCSKASNDYEIPVDPTDTDNAHTATAVDSTTPLQQLPCIPTESAPSAPRVRVPPLPRSQVRTRPTNLTRQLESELWAASLGHCSEDQLIALATQADCLPNSFEFHPFQHIDWKVQAWIQKSTARRQARKVDETGVVLFVCPLTITNARILEVTVSSTLMNDTTRISSSWTISCL